MDSILGDDISFVFLRETHSLGLISFSKIQPTTSLQSEFIEVSTSLGRTQPFSTAATAINSPFLLKMRANVAPPLAGNLVAVKDLHLVAYRRPQ